MNLYSKPYQTNVAGVYSTQPGFTGGKPVGGNIIGTIPLAFSVIVPVIVIGEKSSIKPTDPLEISSSAGYAMRLAKYESQCFAIWEALKKLYCKRGVIKILEILQL